MAELSDEQIAQEERFLEGLPRFNVAAFLLPPVWGPANGFWVTFLYYPAWLFTDNIIYAAYSSPSAMSIAVAVLAALTVLLVSVAFSLVSQPIAAHRAAERGVSRERYLGRQRIWAWASILIACAMLSFATWYNLAFRSFA